ncbi:MAG TPA: DUF1858 domain-containing protein [Planctomycetes bacterium]|nr:DUF1858 domain-containing protein [Planctomycetota bacterium]
MSGKVRIMNISPEATIADVLAGKQGAAETLRRFGLDHCSDCSAGPLETLIDGCEAHGVDIQPLLDALNSLPDTA